MNFKSVLTFFDFECKVGFSNIPATVYIMFIKGIAYRKKFKSTAINRNLYSFVLSKTLEIFIFVSLADLVQIVFFFVTHSFFYSSLDANLSSLPICELNVSHRSTVTLKNRTDATAN